MILWCIPRLRKRRNNILGWCYMVWDIIIYIPRSASVIFSKKYPVFWHTISVGVIVYLKKIKVIMDFPTPNNVNEVISFIRLTIYYKMFIKSFSNIGHPITSLERKGKKVVWSPECEANIQQLKTF
jgi:hypothetical protein